MSQQPSTLKALIARAETPEQAAAFKCSIFGRGAEANERVGEWLAAAGLWRKAGEIERAAASYQQAGKPEEAATLYFESGQYWNALVFYERQADGDTENRVTLLENLLMRSACHRLGDNEDSLDQEQGLELYLHARELLEGIDKAEKEAVKATAWELLGRYGAYLNRFDLIYSGYEMARGYTTLGSGEQGLLGRYKEILIEWREPLLLADIEIALAKYGSREGAEYWQVESTEIEKYGFKEGKHDVAHFVDEQQWEAWQRLARIEENEGVNDYMRSLAPAEMIYIPPGNFLMGSSDDDPKAKENEKPQHWVYLSGYYIDRYPVTNSQYAGFVKAGGYDRQGLWSEAGWKIKEAEGWRKPRYLENRKYNRKQQPVVGVSWYEALACARWLGKMLPSEAQWEKAAGWNTLKKEKRIYPWGNELIMVKREGVGAPEVGLNSPKRDSSYGVADMGGGVYNWCTTQWDNYAYKKQIEDRKKLEELEGVVGRVRKGGYGGGVITQFWRCGYRNRLNNNDRDPSFGFRCIIPHVIPTNPEF